MAAKTRPGKLEICECQKWEIGWTADTDSLGVDEPEVTAYTTGCTKMTNRTFAQGHDAKLKSLFIRAAMEGMEVRYIDGDMTTMTWEQAAARYDFGYQVHQAVAARRTKLAKARKFDLATPQQVGDVLEGRDGAIIEVIDFPKPQNFCWGKVGRWSYYGEVLPDGSFRYERKDGTHAVAAPGQWRQFPKG